MTIQNKFDIYNHSLNMIIKGYINFLIVTGNGGIGKTYNLKQKIKEYGLKIGEDYIIIKGVATGRGIYETLYHYNGKLIIFDDCDVLNKDVDVINLFKSALETDSDRTISWLKTEKSSTKIPSTFNFFGKIIVLSNMSINKLDGALVSRADVIDLTMNKNELFERMVNISLELSYQYDLTEDEVYNILMMIKNNVNILKNLSIRKLLQIFELYKYKKENNIIENEFDLLLKYKLN